MEINSIGPFLQYWESVRERTRRVVQRIPPDKIEWSHAPGRYTLGDLVRHLAAIERWMYAENVKGRPSIYPGHSTDLADGYEAVVNYLDDRHAESVAIFRTVSDAELKAKCTTPAGTQIST